MEGKAESQGTVRASKKCGLFLAGALVRSAGTLSQATNWAGLSVGACTLAHHTDPQAPRERRGNQSGWVGDLNLALWEWARQCEMLSDPSSSGPQGRAAHSKH